MSDQHTSTSAPQHKQRWRELLRVSNSEGIDVVNHSEPVTGTARQITAGAMLGICFVFLAAMLGIQHLDASLQFALKAFVVAIVLLALDIAFVSFTFRAGLSKQAELTTTGLYVGSWIIGEGLGAVALVVALVAVVGHFSASAAVLGIIMIPVGFLAIITVTVLYAGPRLLRERNEEQAKAANSPTSSGAS